MLEVKNITKSYRMGEEKQHVLKGINVNFRDKEFVSILGVSGSGKTTLLNIIGGLDQYDDGDLLIDGVSTKKYKSQDWDAYRNHRIGFIFQSYNLIKHQTVLANVELSLTLSGVSKSNRKKRAIEALTKVGLKDHMQKLPSQLSGGQMQRVAIARALINNPDIILADEPTGALDSNTSVQIMDLLKEISKDKLVIMVTHNPELAKNYSTRIIELKDGLILNDSNPAEVSKKSTESKNISKTSMSLITSLSLSFKNLLNKKGRTILTAIAGSIGIIGIALVLSLTNGLNNYVDDMQKNSASDYPIVIQRVKYDLVGAIGNLKKEAPKGEEGKIVSYDDLTEQLDLTKNTAYKGNNTVEFRKYVENNREKFEKYTSDIKYKYDIKIQLYSKVNNQYNKVMPISFSKDTTDSSASVSVENNLFQELSGNENKLKNSYEVIAGKMPTSYNEIALIVNKNGSIPDSVLYALNIKNRENLTQLIEKINSKESVNIENESISYEDILNISYKLINTLDYYKIENGVVKDCSKDIVYMNNVIDNGLDVKIVGILRADDDDESDSIGYTLALKEYLIKNSEESEITKLQINNPNINVFTGMEFDKIKDTYESNLTKLGIILTENPNSIELYPNNEKDKEKIISLINEYNNQQKDESLKVEYTDEMKMTVGALQKLINIISTAIIAFVAISLVVSSIMIAIITYISVLERTKEIGILRAIGATKKDVSRVFKAETIIEGLISGILGVVVTLLINVIVNLILKSIVKSDIELNLALINIIVLIALSVVLNLIAGLIPARMASKKDPVESLRTE